MAFFLSRILPLLLITLEACAGRELRTDERVVHVREAVAIAADSGAVAVLEVADLDGRPPRASLTAWADGEREPLATASGAEAERLSVLAPGGDLRRVLPPTLAAALAGRMWADPGDPVPGPPWHPPGLPGRTLERRHDDDPRYGPTVRLVLRDASGREEEVARFPGREPPALALRWLPGNRAVAAVRPPEVPGAVVADVALLDLGPAAGRLLSREADALVAAGDAAGAEAVLARARELAPGEAEIPYREAVVRVVRGDRQGALDALVRAVALDPSLYRMRARTDPALAPLRGEPGFEALVRPRALPGR
jgi:hypothetical protein